MRHKWQLGNSVTPNKLFQIQPTRRLLAVKVPKIINNTYVKTIISLAILLYLLDLFGWMGLWGFVLAFTIYVIVKIVILQRESYINGLRYAETKIFGKSLDKENWGKDELKNTKLKFVLNKNKKGQSNTVIIAVTVIFIVFFLFLWALKNFLG